jgi:hypothetical protein
MPYSDTNDPSPRSRNTPTIASGSSFVLSGSGWWKLLINGMTRYAISRSPPATTTRPATAIANAHQYGRT